MDLKALKLPLFLVGSKFRLRIPLEELHTAKKCGQPFMAGVCGANVLTLVPQNPSAFLQKYKI